MTLSGLDLAHFLLALALLMGAAHACGYAFARLRQPRVIGEILGGILLGPTVLGALAPSVHEMVFGSSAATSVVLDAIYQLGLLLLMFAAGSEMQARFSGGERRALVSIGTTGIVLPLLIGTAAVVAMRFESWEGAAATRASFILVFAIAIAVTSIPVISRIMFDLGILETPFARIVLGVAILEDVLLYVLLAVALGLAQGSAADQIGLPHLLGIDPGGVENVVFHVVATLGFLAAALTIGPIAYGWVLRFRYNVIKRGNPVAFQLVFMLALTLMAVFFGVVPLYGAFLAGIVVGNQTGEGAAHARVAINDFAFALFVPVYFAIVGLRLDLIHDFDVPAFLGFLAFACVVKAASVYLGAAIAGETRSGSLNLAIALNARGGPGIVLASVALDAAIIDRGFYATLVMLAIVTSLIAGSWLERIVRSKRQLR